MCAFLRKRQSSVVDHTNVGGVKLISDCANLAQAFEFGAFSIFNLHKAVALFRAALIVGRQLIYLDLKYLCLNNVSKITPTCIILFPSVDVT